MITALLLHEGTPLAPHDAWSAWSWEPGVLLTLGATAVLYAVGSRRLRSGSRRRGRTRRLEAVAFWGGWLVLGLALVSPLHAMGGALLWAHMAQHELLMVVAAPLLVLGRPLVVSLWALPAGRRRLIGAMLGSLRPLGRRLGRVEIAWLVHAAAILAWHVPALYDRTVASELVHSLQHASFLGSALLFWWSVLTEARLRARHGGAVLSLFTTAMYKDHIPSNGVVLGIPPGWSPSLHAMQWQTATGHDYTIFGGYFLAPNPNDPERVAMFGPVYPPTMSLVLSVNVLLGADTLS